MLSPSQNRLMPGLRARAPGVNDRLKHAAHGSPRSDLFKPQLRVRQQALPGVANCMIHQSLSSGWFAFEGVDSWCSPVASHSRLKALFQIEKIVPPQMRDGGGMRTPKVGGKLRSLAVHCAVVAAPPCCDERFSFAQTGRKHGNCTSSSVVVDILPCNSCNG